MVTIEVQIENLDKVIDAFDRFPQEIARMFGYAGLEAAEYILTHDPGLKQYPVKVRPGPAQPFKTAKQRRYFFWALRKGVIEVPYVRGGKQSQRYGSQFTAEAMQNGQEVIIGNRATYAKYLGGDPATQQSRYMAALGWKSLAEEARKLEPEVTAIYQGWVDKTIVELGL